MKELTKAEEQIMQYIWKLKKCFLKDILDEFPEPRPAHTTVSTVLKTLILKNFVSFNSYGKIREYFPLISKTEYFQKKFKTSIIDYFNGSVINFASTFTSDNELNITELEEIKKMVENEIKKRK